MSETEVTSSKPAPVAGTPTSADQNTPAPTEKPIDPVLIEKLAGLKSIVSINKILDNCIVQGSMAGDILVGKKFLEELHAPILKECQSHPDWERAVDPQGFKKKQQATAQAEAKRARKLSFKERLAAKLEERRLRKAGKKLPQIEQ